MKRWHWGCLIVGAVIAILVLHLMAHHQGQPIIPGMK